MAKRARLSTSALLEAGESFTPPRVAIEFESRKSSSLLQKLDCSLANDGFNNDDAITILVAFDLHLLF